MARASDWFAWNKEREQFRGDKFFETKQTAKDPNDSHG